VGRNEFYGGLDPLVTGPVGSLLDYLNRIIQNSEKSRYVRGRKSTCAFFPLGPTYANVAKSRSSSLPLRYFKNSGATATGKLARYCLCLEEPKDVVTLLETNIK